MLRANSCMCCSFYKILLLLHEYHYPLSFLSSYTASETRQETTTAHLVLQLRVQSVKYPHKKFHWGNNPAPVYATAPCVLSGEAALLLHLTEISL